MKAKPQRIALQRGSGIEPADIDERCSAPRGGADVNIGPAERSNLLARQARMLGEIVAIAGVLIGVAKARLVQYRDDRMVPNRRQVGSLRPQLNGHGRGGGVARGSAARRGSTGRGARG